MDKGSSVFFFCVGYDYGNSALLDFIFDIEMLLSILARIASLLENDESKFVF